MEIEAVPERGRATVLRQRRRRILDLRLRSDSRSQLVALRRRLWRNGRGRAATRITLRCVNRGGRIVDEYSLAKWRIRVTSPISHSISLITRLTVEDDTPNAVAIIVCV